MLDVHRGNWFLENDSFKRPYLVASLYCCGDVCSRGMLINRETHLSHENLERQADKMVARSNQVLQPVTVGNNVTVPSVDRGREDPRNLICVVNVLFIFKRVTVVTPRVT
jgi:hypothetical protein